MLSHGYSLAAAANSSGAARETIRRRTLGQGSRAEQQRTGEQRLTRIEEDMLVKFIMQLELHGFPMRRSDVEISALALLREQDPAATPLGTRWFERFIKRHSNLLAFKTKASLSRERSRGLTAASATHFFDLVSGPRASFPRPFYLSKLTPCLVIYSLETL